MQMIARACLALSAGFVAAFNPVSADDHVRPSDQAAMDASTRARIEGNSGITLQWIGWDNRGVAMLRRGAEGDIYLSGGQISPDGPGTLWVDGRIVEAGGDYFIFEGLIRIADAPDVGRVCEQTKRWRFAVTQNRKYYRLREFEWCDGLTDYVDIYF